MQKLLTGPASCLFVFFSISLSFCCCGLWFVVTVTLWWWSPSSYFHCIITPNTHTHTYTSNHKRTPFLLCSKLTGHILGLRAPWGAILAALSLKTPYLHAVSYLSSVLSYDKGKLLAYYFIGWQNNMLLSSYGQWFSTKHIKIDYFPPLTAFFFVTTFRCKSKTQIKLALGFSVKVYGEIVKRVCFGFNREAALYSMWPHASCDPKVPVITAKNVSHENMAYIQQLQVELGVEPKYILSTDWILSMNFVPLRTTAAWL